MTTDTQTQTAQRQMGLMSYHEAYGGLKGVITQMEWNVGYADEVGQDPEETMRMLRIALNIARQTINTFEAQR